MNNVKYAQEQERELNNHQVSESLNASTFGKKQRGASLLDFIFWMGLAAAVIAGIAGLASSGGSKLAANQTITEVTEIRQAVNAWAGGSADLSGVSLSEICTAGYGYSNAAWCDINQFGGTYTVSANSNSALVDILISNVDSEVIWALANQLAPLSAERCQRMQSCGTIQASGTNITVTM